MNAISRDGQGTKRRARIFSVNAHDFWLALAIFWNTGLLRFVHSKSLDKSQLPSNAGSAFGSKVASYLKRLNISLYKFYKLMEFYLSRFLYKVRQLIFEVLKGFLRIRFAVLRNGCIQKKTGFNLFAMQKTAEKGSL